MQRGFLDRLLALTPDSRAFAPRGASSGRRLGDELQPLVTGLPCRLVGRPWDVGLAWLAVAVAVNTVVSPFYYGRWIRAALRPAAQLDERETTGDGGRGRSTRRRGGTLLMALAVGPLGLMLG